MTWQCRIRFTKIKLLSKLNFPAVEQVLIEIREDEKKHHFLRVFHCSLLRNKFTCETRFFPKDFASGKLLVVTKRSAYFSFSHQLDKTRILFKSFGFNKIHNFKDAFLNQGTWWTLRCSVYLKASEQQSKLKRYGDSQITPLMVYSRYGGRYILSIILRALWFFYPV